MSGALAPSFTAAIAVYKAEVAFVNQHGGIAGRPVKLDLIDSAGTPAQAISALQAYLDKTTPQMVVPGQVTALITPVLPLITQKKLFSAGTSVAKELNDPTKYPYYFALSPTTDQVESAEVAHLKGLGFSKLAFLGPDNASGRSALAAFKVAAGSAGATVTSALMDPTSLDATAQLSQLQSAKPDVLVLDGYGPFAGVFLKTRTKLSWDVTTEADETFSANDLAAQSSPADIKGVKMQFFSYSVKGDQASSTPAAQVVEGVLAATANPTPLWPQAQNWDLLLLGKIAGDKAGPDADGTALKNALESVDAIPASVKDYFFGTPELAYSSTNHAPKWLASDFSWYNAGTLQSGLLVPSS